MRTYPSVRTLTAAGAASMVLSAACLAPAFAASNDISVTAVAPNANMRAVTMPAMPVQIDENGDYIPLPTPQVKYSFDEAAVRSMVDQKSAIGLATCNRDAVMKALGLENVSSSVYSVGMIVDKINYSVDVKNCTISGNSETQTARPYDPSATVARISLADARAKVDAFLKNSTVLSSMGFSFGAVELVSANSDMPIPMYAAADAGTAAGSTGAVEPTVATTATGTSQDGYVSVDFMVPTLFNGKTIYTVYGSKVGLSVSVNAEGVTYFSANTLPFTLANRSADEASADDLVKLIRNGGNSPYYPSYPSTGTTTVKLGAPEQVFVLIEDYRNGTPVRYVSTGMRLVSDRPVGTWSKLPYTVVVSDYSVGNSNGMTILR